MSTEAWNKVTQTHDTFKKIIAPLKEHFNLSFGYMKVFSKDANYYRIMDNLKCNKNLITNIEKGRVFSDRNITNYFDGNYRFTLWPIIPKHEAMDICYECGVWNGITISKINDSSVDLYWFNTEIQSKDWCKFFMENKFLLLEFIFYFEKHKKILGINDYAKENELFKFKQGFDISIPESEYINNESLKIEKFIQTIRSNNISNNFTKQSILLSCREREVLSLICNGYTAKLIASKFNISVRTVECYVGRIKHKTGLRYKTELIKFGENDFNRIL